MTSRSNQNPKFFYEIEAFPFLKKWQAIWQEILLEWQQNQEIGTHQSFEHYTNKSNPNSKWTLQTLRFFLMDNKPLLEFFPKIKTLLNSEIIAAEFSQLSGGTHILPHHGFSKMILRCHLPLIVPDGEQCGIRVGNEIRHWKTGEFLIFDDSFEHEAWNNSTESRLVLMLDFPNPNYGYSAEEICRYKLENLKDETLLALAPQPIWLKAFEARELPLG